MEKDKVAAMQKTVLIGGSAGSLDVLLKIVPALKNNLAVPLVIILHRKSTNDSLLPQLLASKTSLTVKEIEEKEAIIKGRIYIAPADYHVLFEKDQTFSLDDSEKVNYSRPSIDVSFQSAAEVYGASLTCILLSGANADGTDGFITAKNHGGTIIAQEPSTAEVAYMPEQAIQHSAVDHIFDAAQIVAYLNNL